MLKHIFGRAVLLLLSLCLATNAALADCDCEEVFYDLFVEFLNLPHGDSALVSTQGGKTVLIDTGFGDGIEKIHTAISAEYYLRGKIDYLIGTHPSDESIGNMAKLIETAEVGSIYLSKAIFPTQSGQEINAAAKKKGIRVNEITGSTTIKLNDEISIRFLPSNTDNTYIKLSYKNKSFLFVRGSKEITDQEVMRLGASFKSDFLNISSYNNGSICDSFLKAVSPRFTVVSGKSTTFVYDSILARLLKICDSEIRRTDRDGWISIDTDGHVFSSFTEVLFSRGDPEDGIVTLASSVLSGGNYSHENIWDKNPKTAWVEGNKEDGIGEFLEYGFFGKEPTINSIGMINGYAKSVETYQNNNRVKTIRVSFGTGESYLFSLRDNEFQMQVFRLPKPIKDVKLLRITIVDVYKGKKYRDTCISEIAFN